ncbi:MAG: flavin reductase family protein [Actinomycetota bacterium]|nr:flavin reductase family protein [Actinomycetota bacterium]
MTRIISPEEFRRTIGMFATGVTVVTTAVDDVLHGMTANAFASVSLDPLLVLVCVDRQAGMHGLLPRAASFAVTVLSAEQQAESAFFASPRRPAGRDQFDAVRWQPAPVSGCPVLSDGVAWLDCRVTETHAGGDHSIFLGEVVELGVLRPDADPLLYFAGSYRRLVADHEPAPGTPVAPPASG